MPMQISKSQTTPTPPPETYTSPMPVNRRAASGKQRSTVASGQWPIVTRTAYDQLLPGGVVPDELRANLRLRRLAMAKAALGWAMQMHDGALHDHRPTRRPDPRSPAQQDADAKIYNLLRSQRDRLEKMWKDFPLEVVG